MSSCPSLHPSHIIKSNKIIKLSEATPEDESNLVLIKSNVICAVSEHFMNE